ncbi:MAG TPA: response regulator, partial [Lunatimonas sp.]|nr:response regulator [Lunatimonas sp.]
DLRYERLEKQKQEELNQLKLRFFTNISHELRTPLMLIKAPLETLSLRTDLPKSVNHQLESIHTNAIRLLRLINQLLDFRKQETGHLQLTVKKVNVRKYINQIFKAFEVVAMQRSISFQMNEGENVPEEMWFDPNQIEKVFFNLIYNSFKFTPDGGKIRIRLKNTSFSPEGNALSVDALAIEIEDNGKGILPQHTEKIFERFFQTDQDNNYQNVGTGIGLALSKNLVDFHKGEIKVSSIPGVKTVFTVILRKGFEHFSKHELLHQEEEQKTKTWLSEEILALRNKGNKQNVDINSPTTLIKKKPKGILIVEDNVELLDLLSKGLQNTFQVFLAKNGQEGLDQLAKEKPDLVISDVMMPIMDGIELCGRIRQNIETSHIPVILLTAKSSHIHQLEGYESGADDYITKPFPLDLLQLKVKNLLEGRERFQQQFKTSPNLEPSRVKVSSADEKLMQLAINSVEKNMENSEYSVHDLVKDLGLSRTILFEKFKALIGQTPNDFIQMIRLKRAAQLILETDLKFSEIGYMVGFSNPKYFSKCFQKQFGSTPSQYKKEKA